MKKKKTKKKHSRRPTALSKSLKELANVYEQRMFQHFKAVLNESFNSFNPGEETQETSEEEMADK